MSDTAPQGLNRKILVIDDDRSARLLLDRLLTRAGYSVTIVDSAEQGLARLAEVDFDLLITDKNLPGMDGLEVVRRARGTRPRLRTLLITGFPTPETREQAMELGVFAFITKPFGVHEILEQCERAIRSAQPV